MSELQTSVSLERQQVGHCHPDSSPRPHVAACGSPAQRESIFAMRINHLESLAKQSHQAARAQEQMNSPTERHACRKLWGGGRNVLKELNARKTQREANLDVFKSSLSFLWRSVPRKACAPFRALPWPQYVPFWNGVPPTVPSGLAACPADSAGAPQVCSHLICACSSGKL